MESSLMQKLQKRKSSPARTEDTGPAPEKGEDPSSRIFKRLRQEGITEKKTGPSVRTTPRTVAGVPTSGEEFDQLFENEQEDPVTPRFCAGKRVDEGGPAPDPVASPTGRVRPSPSSKLAHPGWETILEVMSDIGWETVMGRVERFISRMTLTEVAQRFQSPQETLVRRVMENWKEGGTPEGVLLISRCGSLEEAATAFCVYVSSFKKDTT